MKGLLFLPLEFLLSILEKYFFLYTTDKESIFHSVTYL